MMRLRLAKHFKGSRAHLSVCAYDKVNNGILPGYGIGQAVCIGSFRRPAAAYALFNSFAFGFVPCTCISQDRFFYIFYFFHAAKVAGRHRKKVQLVEDFKTVSMVNSLRGLRGQSAATDGIAAPSYHFAGLYVLSTSPHRSCAIFARPFPLTGVKVRPCRYGRGQRLGCRYVRSFSYIECPFPYTCRVAVL